MCGIGTRSAVLARFFAMSERYREGRDPDVKRGCTGEFRAPDMQIGTKIDRQMMGAEEMDRHLRTDVDRHRGIVVEGVVNNQ